MEKKKKTKFPKKIEKPFFGPTSPISPFSKFKPVTHNNTWTPNTMPSFSENNNEPIPRKLPDGRMEGQKHGRTDRPQFIGPFWP